MRMFWVDRVLVWVGTPLFVAVVFWGAASTAPRSAAARLYLATRGERPVGALEGDERQDQVARYDDRLPEGVTIDPESLELVGFELQPEPGTQAVDWDVLEDYEYQEGLTGLPEALRALDGQRVTMAGFLMPLYEFSDIKEFSLVASHWSCCFGVAPGLNGWVHIQLDPRERGLRNTTEPIKVVGTFRVRERKEEGYVIAIYEIGEAKGSVIGW